MTCPTCNGLGARMVRRHAIACALCLGSGESPRPALACTADIMARRLHQRALKESQHDPYKALVCLQAACVLLGVTGARTTRLDGLARQGMAVALLRGAAEDVTAFLRDVEPYIDGRTQSELIAMMLRLRGARRQGRELTELEVIRG